MALRSYLAGEVVEDLADGLITRREALRRLGLLGVGVAASTSLLAACGGDDDNEGAPSAVKPTQATTGTGATDGTIRFDGDSGELIAAWAEADDPKAGVLIVHENRGLTPHFLALPGRFAAQGYSALCVDLLSAEGGTAKLADEAAAQGALGAAPLDRLLGDLRSGISQLEARVPDKKIGAVGFCFGGAMVWNLLQAGETRLAAAAPFYGPAPAEPDFSKAKAAVLAVYGELDTRVNASRESAEAALQAAKLDYEIKTYPGADHAFFNDTGARYNESAAKQANADLLEWFGTHLA